MVMVSLYGNRTLTMIGDFSENEESVYAASLLLSSWLFAQRTEHYCRDTGNQCLPSQFPVLSYGTSLGTKNGVMGTHTMEVSKQRKAEFCHLQGNECKLEVIPLSTKMSLRIDGGGSSVYVLLSLVNKETALAF